MEKVLEKNPIVKDPIVKKNEWKPVEPKKVDQSLLAIERLTVLNGSLVAKVQSLSSELDSLKIKIDQVASRLGL